MWLRYTKSSGAGNFSARPISVEPVRYFSSVGRLPARAEDLALELSGPDVSPAWFLVWSPFVSRCRVTSARRSPAVARKIYQGAVSYGRDCVRFTRLRRGHYHRVPLFYTSRGAKRQYFSEKNGKATWSDDDELESQMEIAERLLKDLDSQSSRGD